MASPNCCGCISLILSGMKDQGVETTPYFVKRAIENTAQPIEETVGGGAGLVQVERAFDYLLSYKDSTLQRVHFDIKCQVNSVNFRGLYLKDHDQVNETRDYQITVEPKFFENWSRSPIVDQSFDKDETLLRSREKLIRNILKYLINVCVFIKAQQEKISLNRRLGLIWENEERGAGTNWLESPTYFYLVNNSKQIPIRIRANELEDGKAYFTYVKAVDLEDPKKPCLFKIPITVVKPHL
jgi:tripeptidyl-peptidase-2